MLYIFFLHYKLSEVAIALTMVFPFLFFYEQLFDRNLEPILTYYVPKLTVNVCILSLVCIRRPISCYWDI